MKASRRSGTVLALLALVAAAGSAGSASAGLFGGKAKPAAAAAQPASAAEIRRAIDEQRLLDAGRLLDSALLAGDKDPNLLILGGQLKLSRERYEDALASFKQAEAFDATKADSLEGQGIALSLLGRSDEAVAALEKAVALKPSAWRAWNALGSEYDSRRLWPKADAAYERAITESNRAPIALNNRGFSRLLQGRPDDAAKDFVEALGKKPDLSAARTNLRLAIAMRGEYERAVAGGTQDGEAGILNNAGFAAMMRGDYAAAEDLFDRAMRAKGEYYGRAATNLQLARSLKSETERRAKSETRAP
jgi:Flp pilus assembly protein TadD